MSTVIAKKLDIIDFLRGFSIFTIALMHLVQPSLPTTLRMAASFGGAGVHVFILCSGFGLFLSHLNKPLRYTEFIKKRFSKVYWPYALIVIVYSLWLWYASGLEFFQARELFSHLLLYKMFDNSLDISICYPFWFISTIIQFYITWPLTVKLMKKSCGLFYALLLSVIWWILVAILGYEDYRPWGSCFLQYLWEFALGMQFAKWYKTGVFSEVELESKIKFWHLLILSIVGVTLTGIMGKVGGMLKLFNDIPSLIGYTSLLLMIYKLRIWKVNNLFSWSNKISYELYLVHSLVYSIIKYILCGSLPTVVELSICFLCAYLCAYGYSKMLQIRK